MAFTGSRHGRPRPCPICTKAVTITTRFLVLWNIWNSDSFCIFLFLALRNALNRFLGKAEVFFSWSGVFEFASETEIRSASDWFQDQFQMGCLGPCKLLGQGRRLFGCPLAVIWMLGVRLVSSVSGRPRRSFTMVRQCKGGKSFTPISSNFCLRCSW